MVVSHHTDYDLPVWGRHEGQTHILWLPHTVQALRFLYTHKASAATGLCAQWRCQELAQTKHRGSSHPPPPCALILHGAAAGRLYDKTSNSQSQVCFLQVLGSPQRQFPLRYSLATFPPPAQS